jgi:lantibiotic modifying enzyme
VIRRTDDYSFYAGLAGLLPVLAGFEALDGPLVDAIGEAHRRMADALHSEADRAQQREPAETGVAFGLMGTLLGYESWTHRFSGNHDATRAAALEAIRLGERKSARGSAWARYPLPHGEALHAVCSGAPGVALAAVAAWRWTGLDVYRHLFEDASQTLVVRGFPDDSFCCGTLGRVEVLIEIARTLGSKAHLEAARKLFAKVDPSTLKTRRWKDGKAGYEHAKRRLANYPRLDLPGFPWSVGRAGSPAELTVPGGRPRRRRR